MSLLNAARTNSAPRLALVIAVAGAALALLTGQNPWLTIGIELVTLMALATLAWPDVATLAVVFLVYTNALDVAVTFHGVPYLLGASVPAVLIFPLATYLVFRRQKLIITPVLPLVFLFLVVQILGALFSMDIDLAMTGLIRFLLEGVALYLLITNVVRTPETLRRVIWILLLAGALIGALSFYQQITHTFHNNYWGFAQVSNAAFRTGSANVYGDVYQPRLTGPIGEENRFAQVMLMLIPLGLFRLWGERSLVLRGLAAVATASIALGLATAFSRGAVVGFAAMLLIMVFMRYIKWYQIAIILLGVVLLLTAVPAFATRALRLQGLVGLVSEGGGTGATAADSSLQGRANEVVAALLVFQDHPVIGVGPEMFRYQYQAYADRAGFKINSGTTRQAHDLYLGIAANNGALGLLCFFGIMFVTFRDLVRTRRRWKVQRPELANMATGFLLVLVTYLATGVALHFAFIRYFWLMLALANVASHVADAQALPTPDATGPSRVTVLPEAALVPASR
jgi:O-antigen ligase